MINIIVIHDGVIEENILVTRRNYDEKNVYGICEAAEKIFVNKIKEKISKSVELPQEEIEEAIENGFWSQDNGYEVIINHPNVKYIN